ncbi:MAG: 50S ribosomal protein L9 [Candidatus Spyradosoma sp.]
MALSEVLLKKPVAGLGAEGDQVKVRAGYARNFLLPQGIAVPVTQANRKQIEALKKARAIREAKELDEAKALAAKLEGTELSFAVKTGEGGKLFGSVSTADIAAKLAEQGIEIARKQIHLPHGPIKLLGKHTASVKLHAEISVEISVEIVSENPVVEEEAPKAKKGKKAASAEEESAAPAPAAE